VRLAGGLATLLVTAVACVRADQRGSIIHEKHTGRFALAVEVSACFCAALLNGTVMIADFVLLDLGVLACGTRAVAKEIGTFSLATVGRITALVVVLATARLGRQ